MKKIYKITVAILILSTLFFPTLIIIGIWDLLKYDLIKKLALTNSVVWFMFLIIGLLLEKNEA